MAPERLVQISPTPATPAIGRLFIAAQQIRTKSFATLIKNNESS